MSRYHLTLKQGKELATKALGFSTYEGKTIFSSKFDCDWKSIVAISKETYYVPAGCTKCVMCKYYDFLDYAHSTAPSGSRIEYLSELDKWSNYELEPPLST